MKMSCCGCVSGGCGRSVCERVALARRRRIRAALYGASHFRQTMQASRVARAAAEETAAAAINIAFSLPPTLQVKFQQLVEKPFILLGLIKLECIYP